ncbi:MAG: hypothetical protein U9Q00_02800 [Synergistota bacterium]|nr:hypothetical protein [Synergistota bacterium]
MRSDPVAEAFARSEEWICDQCGVELETAEVTLTYLGASFPAKIPRCPRCGMVFIPSSVALGKMLQVEQGLEDK